MHVPSPSTLTRGPTVTAGLVARQVGQAGDDGASQLLQSAVLEGCLVPTQGGVQGLLLAVLQYGHPAGETWEGRGGDQCRGVLHGRGQKGQPLLSKCSL